MAVENVCACGCGNKYNWKIFDNNYEYMNISKLPKFVFILQTIQLTLKNIENLWHSLTYLYRNKKIKVMLFIF